VGCVDQHGSLTKTPEDIARALAVIRRQRTAVTPYDVALIGQSTPVDGLFVRAYADAGVTWWLESLHSLRGTVEEMIARVEGGHRADRDRRGCDHHHQVVGEFLVERDVVLAVHQQARAGRWLARGGSVSGYCGIVPPAAPSIYQNDQKMPI
jgi:FAD/FMN-containing dehydrogenase